MNTLLIADDHELLRDAIAAYAERTGSFRVVGSVGDAQSAMSESMRLKPDVLLLDVEMPGRDPLASISEFKAVSPSTKVVILTAYCRDTFIQVALRNGAAGYLLKSDPPTVLFDALVRVTTGNMAFSKQVADRLYSNRTNLLSSRLERLSARELEVLTYIGKGMDNGTMAKAMSISKRTVERHVSRLMDALGIRARGDLQVFASEHGLTQVNAGG
ncbi:MAG: response regulator transcription factor [Phycisphaerales bacterium]